MVRVLVVYPHWYVITSPTSFRKLTSSNLSDREINITCLFHDKTCRLSEPTSFMACCERCFYLARGEPIRGRFPSKRKGATQIRLLSQGRLRCLSPHAHDPTNKSRSTCTFQTKTEVRQTNLYRPDYRKSIDYQSVIFESYSKEKDVYSTYRGKPRNERHKMR